MSHVTHSLVEPTSRQATPDAAQGTPRGTPASFRRVYLLSLERSRQPPAPDFLPWIAGLGFDSLLLSLPPRVGTADIGALPPIAAAAAAAGLNVHLDLTLDVATGTADLVGRHPEFYRKVAPRFADPRTEPEPPSLHVLNLEAQPAIEAFAEDVAAMLRRFTTFGVNGFRCGPDLKVPPILWRDLIASAPALHFSVWANGTVMEAIRRLPSNCFNVAYNGLAWWDFGAGWLRAELDRLRAIAPIANTVGIPQIRATMPALRQAARRMLDVAANNGHGLLMPMGFEFGIPSDFAGPDFGSDDWPRLRDHARLDLTAALRDTNERLAVRGASLATPAVLTSEDAPVAVLFEAPAQLTLANRHLGRPATFDPAAILPLLDGNLGGFADPKGRMLGSTPVRLGPGEVLVFTGTAIRPIVTAVAPEAKQMNEPAATSLADATASPRVAIEAIEPAIDGGRFAVKRIVGERVTVEADVFADGHGVIAAALQWRATDESDWREAAMRLAVNDRWSASFSLERVGPYRYRIVAWPDRFETWRDEVTKKRAAGLDVTLELQEGMLLVEAIAAAAARGGLGSLLASLKSQGPADRLALLTGDAAAAEIARADARPGRTISREMAVNADRRAAEFASWYELFPRNQSGDPARHGTFRDVMDRLPAIQDMGFDVLYFPPIHPIGRINRKGRDNSLTPAEDDPGSPYAIGAAEGGHDAILPELGTIDDFRALRDAAAAHGLELALDFAIQCSPDHPWLREHPEWFDWRPDGGLRYAENPPKKYEDIVNVDFYRPGAIPGLWLALRDVVAFWAEEGVRIFRVDNPHTKPFAFWEWLIADIRAKHPDTLFLSEAFTRPKVMYRLAKLGFSQSYTYFTWRNEKWEIEAYLRELTAGEPLPGQLGGPRGVPAGTNVPDFFRPNFFVNTPDINPIFLQNSGRAGFLIRAALATTLSGLWGMLQGFEFCEATPLPGREEYAASDKYQIRVRPERMAGDIVDEITQLNAIRRANPALQSHRGLAFHNASNDRVLWYRKANADRSNVVLVAVSLDPFGPQTTEIEVPLWEWGLGDDGALDMVDLVRGNSFVWQGKRGTITLDPRTLPFAIWRARPREAV